MKTLLAYVLGALVFVCGQASATSVGFAMLRVADGAESALEVGIWYPADAPPRPTAVGLSTQDIAPDAPVRGRDLPLVAISHGNGGNFASHAELALALAQAGFVVAAPTHTGDNHRDQSRAIDVAGRTRSFVAVIEHLAGRWQAGVIDPARIGAFGFSAGGFTVLTVAGGEPDLSRIGPHCAANPDFYDCRLIAAARGDSAGAVRGDTTGFVREGRVRAIVVAAPAFGFAFAPAGLARVTMPVQLWQATNDEILPPRIYAEPVRAALPRPPELHVVERAGHFDFLGPCSDALSRAAPAICESGPGFDRAAFARLFTAEVVGFFRRTLAP